jgi:HSP20 family molecular chaperone IbpA
MVLENAVEWTKRTLSRIGVRDREKVPIHSGYASTMLVGARATAPSVDVFESERAFRLVFDVPGASTATTHVFWDEHDTLSVHARRSLRATGEPWVREYDECDWFRSLRLSPEVDASKATCALKDGVLRVVLPLERTRAASGIPIFDADPA